jgi:type 1 glutamine amidotransferase
MRPIAGLIVAVTIAAVSVQITAQQPPAAPPATVQQPPAGAPPGRAGEAPQPPGGRTGGQGRGRGQLGGAAAGFVVNPTYDTDAPVLPADFKPGGVLIFSKTNGFRDEPAIQASNAALAAIATMRGWPSFVTENGAVMNAAQLAKFKLVVWSNASGDVLTEEQRAAFKTWVEQGGAYLGIHGAGGDPVVSTGHTSLADWKWYVDTLVGAQFVVHSSIMPGDIHIEDAKSPITKGLPAVWHRSEEWYAFEKSSRNTPGFHILATVDEKSYTPGRATMPEDHPLVWWHCVEKGRSVYSALGHAAIFYSEPLMIHLLDNAMGWLIAESSKPCTAR